MTYHIWNIMHSLHWKETIIFFSAKHQKKKKKYRHLIGPARAERRREGERPHFWFYTYCFMHSKLLDGKKKETVNPLCSSCLSDLRGWIFNLKKENTMLFLYQSDCPGRRPSAPQPMPGEKRTFLGAARTLRQKRGSLWCGTVHVSGLQPASFIL